MYKPLILVVDDNATHLKVCQVLLLKYGFEPCCVASGKEAIEAFGATDDFAAVLLDWRMPGMDGIQCLRRLREIDQQRNRHTPMIAITAAATSRDRETLLEAGMDDYLAKPFTTDQLRRLLNSHLSHEQLSAVGLLQAAVMASKSGDTVGCDLRLIQIVSLLQHIFGSDKKAARNASKAIAGIMTQDGMKNEAQLLTQHADRIFAP